METDEQRNLNLWYFHQELLEEEDVKIKKIKTDLSSVRL